MKQLPNILTFARLVLIPVFIVLMIDPSDIMRKAALGVFILAALTDYLDGIIARRFGWVTDFGKLLDPLADKILVMTALVMMVSLRTDLTGAPWIPGWIVVLILAREIWVTGIRGIAASRGVVVPASWAGKFKSTLQMIGIILVFFQGSEFDIFGRTLPLPLVGLNLLVFSIAVSYWGAVDYTLQILGSDEA